MMTKDRARVNLPAGATGVRASDFDDARAKFVQGYKDYLPPELRDK